MAEHALECTAQRLLQQIDQDLEFTGARGLSLAPLRCPLDSPPLPLSAMDRTLTAAIEPLRVSTVASEATKQEAHERAEALLRTPIKVQSCQVYL